LYIETLTIRIVMINKILDTSIYYSFDKSGFNRHKKTFNDTYSFNKGSNALITGGTSGIGLAASKELSKQGVKITITGRNLEKGNKASAQDKNIDFNQLDMSCWEEIPSFVNTLSSLDYIVLNAGGMPAKFNQNKQGIESQFASQLFGHYYLIKELQKKNKLNIGAKIVWVTSGGMYLSKLNLEDITKIPTSYDKVSAYANVKRAQVTLLPFLKNEFPDQTITAMHPGWVETPGVSEAIPKFNEKMEGKLRTPLQGADTILWLLGTKRKIESGILYFDRRKVASHFFWFTKSSDKKLKDLIKILRTKFI
jgi:dehydrogenase/reductase SDR family protein 12